MSDDDDRRRRSGRRHEENVVAATRHSTHSTKAKVKVFEQVHFCCRDGVETKLAAVQQSTDPKRASPEAEQLDRVY